MTPDEIKALREAVKAVYPDVQLAFHKRDTYVERYEDSFYIHKGDAFLGSVNVKDTTAYWIIKLVKFYTYAYELAERRTKDKFIAKLCDTFDLQEKDDDNDC